MPKYHGIIALDLDGTLLNSQKELSPRNRAALEAADAAGYAIVPTTGRFFGGMPQVNRQLPMSRYAITCKGAEVLDRASGQVLYRAEMPWQRAIALMEYLDGFDLIYDCYLEGFGRMTEAMKLRIDEVVPQAHSRKMLHELRLPVPELKGFLTQQQKDVQKVQFFTKDPALRLEMLERLPGLFPDLQVSSALPNNVEINAQNATKGKALLALAAQLGVDPKNTYAFGDGLNDCSMLRDAGTGIAMENASAAVKQVADTVTLHCDEDGVAAFIETHILPWT